MKKLLLGLCVILASLSMGCGRKLPLEIPLLSPSHASDEEQIAAILDDVQRGMQTRSIFKVLAHVARGYRDEDGRDYDAVRSYLDTAFHKYREIRITRARPQVIVQGNRARAIETFGTVAEPLNLQTDVPLNIQGRLNVYFERVGDEWQITEWKSAS